MNRVFLLCLCIFTHFVAIQNIKASEMDPPQDGRVLLTRIQGKTLIQIQINNEIVDITNTARGLGNTLSVNKGELQVYCPLAESNEPHLAKQYDQLKKETKKIHDSSEVWHYASSYFEFDNLIFRAPKELDYVATGSLNANRTIFGTQGDIKFTASTLNFGTCFLEVDPDKTKIYIFPYQSTKSRIKHIQFKPKSKSVLLMQGSIDFITYDFRNFIISDCNIEIHFHPIEKPGLYDVALK